MNCLQGGGERKLIVTEIKTRIFFSVWLVFSCWLGLCPVALGDTSEEKIKFFIPAKRADISLTEFARTTGQKLLFPYDIVSQYETNEVVGEYSADEALSLLLQDTGLVVTVSDQGNMIVQIDRERGRKTLMNKLYGYLARVAAALMTTGASAQSDNSNTGYMLEEIVVTARKREESLQDTPVSVAAFTSIDIEQRGMVDFSELGEFTPNVTFDYTAPIAAGNSAAIIMIRGVGSADWTLGVDPGVGVYLDGIYVSRTIGQVMDTVDVERIEVLRGPQGTLFGRNTIGGAISVVTKKPTMDKIYGRAELTVGSYDRVDGNAYINAPFSDTLAASASFSKRTRDGYVKNLFPGAPDLGDNDDTSTRMALRWEPSDSFLFDLSADYSETDEAPAANVLIDVIEDPASPIRGFTPLNNILSGDPQCLFANNDPGRFSNPNCLNSQFVVGPFNTISSHLSQTPELNDGTYGINVRPASELTTWGIGGTVEWQFNDNLTVKSLTAHRRIEDAYWSRDGQHSANQAHILARTANSYEQRQTSQEFQLLGSAFDDRLNFIIGAFYLVEEGDHNDIVELPLNTVIQSAVTVDNSSTAVFAQGTYDITDKLAVTLGVRYTDEEKELDPDVIILQDRNGLNAVFRDCMDQPIPVPGDGACILPPDPVTSDSIELDPYVNLAYDWTDDRMTYVSYSEGFKGGAFTQRAFPPVLETPVAGPEFIKVYEAGFKSTWLDNRLRINGAVFLSDYTDMQVTVATTTGTSGVIGAIGNVTGNAAEAELKGIELEITAVPVERALLQLGIGYLDAKYTKLDNSVAFLTKDHKLVNAPEWNVTGVAQYELGIGAWGTLTPRLDLSYTSAVYNDAENFPLLIQDGYTLVNLSLTWRDANDVWSLMAAGRNLTDKTYLVTGRAASGIVEGVYGLPATWSLTLRRNFD